MFDSREYLADLEPPVFVAPNGRKYVGRILSHPQWVPLQGYLNDLSDRGSMTNEKIHLAAARISRAMFPKPWWKFWQHSATWFIMRLPPTGQLKALWSFMDSQGPALGVVMDPSPGTKQLLESNTGTEE